MVNRLVRLAGCGLFAGISSLRFTRCSALRLANLNRTRREVRTELLRVLLYPFLALLANLPLDATASFPSSKSPSIGACAAAREEGRQAIAHCAAAGGAAHLRSSRESVQAPQAGTKATQIHDSETLLMNYGLA